MPKKNYLIVSYTDSSNTNGKFSLCIVWLCSYASLFDRSLKL